MCKASTLVVGLAGQPCMSNQTLLFFATEIACRTSSFSTVLGIHVGLMADQQFHQIASVLLSDQALHFIFLSVEMFLLSLIPQIIVSVTHCGNSLALCPSCNDGTGVVFVVCINVLSQGHQFKYS